MYNLKNTVHYSKGKTAKIAHRTSRHNAQDVGCQGVGCRTLGAQDVKTTRRRMAGRSSNERKSDVRQKSMDRSPTFDESSTHVECAELSRHSGDGGRRRCTAAPRNVTLRRWLGNVELQRCKLALLQLASR
jgi:hypothetical protein